MGKYSARHREGKFWQLCYKFYIIFCLCLQNFCQIFILKPLAFLIYLNHLPNYLQFTAKQFSDDTSLFQPYLKLNISASQLESNLENVSHSVLKWKITFNSDLFQQAQIISSRRTVKSLPSVTCNTVSVTRKNIRNTWACDKLSFYDHFKSKLSKANKAIGIIKRLFNIYPRSFF